MGNEVSNIFSLKKLFSKKKYLLKKKIPDYGIDMQTWEYKT